MSEKTDAAAKPAAANPNEQALSVLVVALSSLKYGHIELTIHDGRVVQLDVTEKKRFTGT